MAEPRVVGILAGGGSLPREVAQHVMARGGVVHIVAIIGEGAGDFGDVPTTRVGWAQIGGMLRALRNAGARELVIAGAVRRPDLAALRPDLGFFLNLPAIFGIIASGGDDSVLTRVVRFFESKGFDVVSPAVVAPALLVQEDALGAHAPLPADRDDIALGFAVLRALGPFDVGQGIVVCDKRIEAIEGAENTDAMLARLASRRRQRGETAAGGLARGVLVKRPKPQQEMRIDMPAIGPATIQGATAAALRGIAVLAGGTLALERAELVQRADAAGIFVTGARDDGAATATPLIRHDVLFRTAGTIAPTARQLADASRGAAAIEALRPFHACAGAVVDRGHVLAIEGGEGASALLARAGSLRQWGRHRSGVAVVSAEHGMPDLAVLGPAAAAARLAGLAFYGCEAGAIPASGIAVLDRLGLFLIAAPCAEEAL